MPDYTTNFNLEKPSANEYFDINIQNKNMNIIDTEIAKKASSTQNGRMSKEDKEKLDAIEEGATNYQHPSTHPASMIAEDGSHRFVSDEQIANWDTQMADLAENKTDKTTTITGTGSLSGGGDLSANRTITHLATAGYKHIPSGGSTDQVLVYGGSSGTATWGSAGAKLVSGSYLGDGTSNRTISLGFTPKFVIVAPNDSSSSSAGIGITGNPNNIYAMAGGAKLENSNHYRPAITTNGFTVSGSLNRNTSSETYYYVAIG